MSTNLLQATSSRNDLLSFPEVGLVEKSLTLQIEAEKFSLVKLSVRARQVVKLVTATPGALTRHSEDPATSWNWIEETLGLITGEDRRILEMLADLFLTPGADIQLIQILSDLSWGSSPPCSN